jgi:hypothetical protein
MKQIERDGVVLARHILPADWGDGLSFFSQDSEFIQVGAWHYDQGKILLAHIHNEVPRIVSRTYETLYIVSGRILVQIYTLQEEIVDAFEVSAGDILILLECGHGYHVLEADTRVLEVKNGPYLGAEVDRHRMKSTVSEG